jgi:hypothetical protein
VCGLLTNTLTPHNALLLLLLLIKLLQDSCQW